jgi:hypothetical protein
MKFVVFHGSFGSPEGNWFPELKEKLGYLGQKVEVPRFPVDDWDELTRAGPGRPPKSQNLKNWLDEFENVLKGFKKGERLCFVGHSLGCLFILHVVDRYDLRLDSAIFVSPFLSLSGGKPWQIDRINRTFYRADFDWTKLRKLIPVSYALYSDNDPYVDAGLSLDFAGKLHSSTILVKRAGHMNSEVNLNEFPLAYELCKTRINLSLYQKYLAHRRELYEIPYIRGKKVEEVIYLTPDPKDVLDEGTFHFRNLQHEGFATFYTAPTFWNPHSVYMREARNAAQRTKNLTRVFMVDRTSDLERPALKEQIRLDLKADVKVYLCMHDEVKARVPEPDFGIWDGEYVCIVHFDRRNKFSEVKLTSRRKDLDEAEHWKADILRKASPVAGLADVAAFARQAGKRA